MTSFFSKLITGALIICAGQVWSAPVEQTRRETFDFGWKFARFGKMPDGSVLPEPGSLNPSITASSTEGSNTAALAVDGDMSTRWCAVDASPNQTLILDMGQSVKADKVEVFWEKEVNHLYKLEGSQDGRKWDGIKSLLEGENKTKSDVVSINGSYRFFKLTIVGTGGANWASVREFRVIDSSSKEIRPLVPKGSSKSPSDPSFNDKSWRAQNLPHDWGVEGPFRMELPNETGKLPWAGIGWYRKSFDVSADSKGKKFYLDFDGVMSRPRVFVNGELAGEWKYGYSSFRVDITPFLKHGGKNTVAVRVDNPDNSSRWYPGGGIYRHVWINESNPVHIANWGVYVTTPEVSKTAASVAVRTRVENHGKEAVTPVVKEEILDKEGKVVASVETAGESIAPGATGEVASALKLGSPRLWDTQNPYLYTLRTTVSVGDSVIDGRETRFGVRTVEWTTKGFFLNGERVQLKGVCQHHDMGPLGGAVHRRAYERQVEILKEFGVNSIRTSHNPPAPELLDVCDEQGILVIDELFDMWKLGKKGNDYHNYFDEWHEKDLVNFCHRDRNHPSVVIWSTGNEIGEQGNKDYFYVSQMLTDLFHREDPSRKVTAGCNYLQAADNGFAATMDVYGFNYKPGAYAKFQEKRPDQPVYGSETSSCVSSRGMYYFPSKEDFWNKGKGFFNFHVSSYDLYAPGWAYRPDIEFKAQDENKNSAGEYVWTGFDYLGEPTPYNQDSTNALNFSNQEEREKYMAELAKLGNRAPSRSSYFGIVDLCGFKKDRFYLYQANWRPEMKMAHILPHWNWNDKNSTEFNRIGKATPVHVYTSGDKAELFLNGKSLGVREKGKEDHNSYRLVWEDVVYEPGKLEVVVTKDGKPWTKNAVYTTGKATQFKVEADRKEILGDGRDLSYITITVMDSKGRQVPTANNQFYFRLSGPGEIIGVCNGDPTDFNDEKGTDKGPFQSPQVKAFNGLAQVIIRSRRGEEGQVVLESASKGMPPIKTILTVKKATSDQLKK